MLMALGSITPLNVAYRATQDLVKPRKHVGFMATSKDFLAVQIVNLLSHIQGKGVSNDQQA